MVQVDAKYALQVLIRELKKINYHYKIGQNREREKKTLMNLPMNIH